jgi:hypothetical protein
MEWRILSASNFEWIWKPHTMMSHPPFYEHDHSYEMKQLYIAQLSIFIVAAYSHRFIESEDSRKDYFVMYGKASHDII